MANPFLKSSSINKSSVKILSPGESENPFLKNSTSTQESTKIQNTGETVNPFLNNAVEKKPVDWATPNPEKWWNKPAYQDTDLSDPNLSAWDKGKIMTGRAFKDLTVSIPTIAYGLLQWPVQAHRQTISEGLQGPQVSSTKRIGISKRYTQPGGIGYLPALVYNMLFGPGQELIESTGTTEGRKAIGQSWSQHPILGPLGTASSLALPLMVAKGFMPKQYAFPLAGKEGLMRGPLAPPEPSLPSKLVKKAFEKFQKSEKGMKFKEYAGMLPEQQKYYNMQYASEMAKSKMLSEAGRSELYTILKKFTPAEKEQFILNLEMAKPKTAQAIAMYKKAGIKIPEPTVNVSRALDLWQSHASEGLDYMMKATEGTLFKGGARSKLLTKSALQRGKAEFKVPLIEKAKEFRAQVKELGGISEKAIPKEYKGLIPKDVIKTKGLSLEEISSKLKVTPEEALSKLRKYSSMQKEFTDLAVNKMTSKFGYKVPIGSKPGARQLNQIEQARWQPTIQALEKKLGTKLSIEEIRGLFEEPSYYSHTWPKDYQYRTSAYSGPTYKPGIWKERKGALDYSREPIKSVSNYDYQLIKYKALNEFKDAVFEKFGEKIIEKNPLQAAEIQKGSLVKYGKGKVLYETPEGQSITIKENIAVPRTIANELNQYYTKTGKLEMAMRSYFDPITNSWKIPVLALSPRWVFNNIMGNFILNTLGGVGIGGYLDAIGATVKAFKMMAEAKKAGSPISFVDALIKQGVPEGVAQGLYRGEGMGINEGLPITKMQKVSAAAKYVPNKVYQFNSTIESFYRTAHYFDKVGKGFNIAQATASVNEFLFDYVKSSQIQRQVIKRIDPFWSWHKNIIRLAVSYPIKYPQRVMFLAFANKLGIEAYDDKLRQAGVNPDNVPEYYKNMFILPWKDENGDDFYISLRGIDPLQDIMIGASSLNPIIKVPLERAFGVNAFTQKPFTSPYTVYGDNEKVTPPMWRHILNNFPQFRVIEDVARPYSIYDTGEPMVNKWGEPYYTKNALLSIMNILGFNVKPRDIERIYRNIRSDEQAKKKREVSYDRSRELFNQKY